MNARTRATVSLFLALCTLPLFAKNYFVYVGGLVCVFAIGAIGLDLLMGYTGQVCFSQAAFFAMGAYGTGVLLSQGVPFVVAIGFGGLLATLAGLIIGVPALRIRGHYLALATMAFGYIVQLALIHGEAVTGGPRGLSVSRPTWPISFESDRAYFYVVLVTTFAMYIFAKNLLTSRIGRSFVAVRENEIVAQSFGIHTPCTKTVAFLLSSSYAGIAGGLYGPLVGFLDPLSFGIMESAFFLLMIVIGGRATLIGAPLGAAFFVILPETLRGFQKVQEIVFGLISLGFLILLPGGVMGLWDRLRFCRGPRTSPELGARAVGGASSPAPVGSLKPKLPSLRTDSFLSAESISISFGGLQALQGVNITLREGQVASLIGPNGAGKTTFLNILSGLYRPDSGKVYFRGRDLLRLRGDQIIRAGISRTFQHVDLFPSLSVVENVMIGLHAFTKTGVFKAGAGCRKAREERRWEERRAFEALEMVGIGELAPKKASDLSFGEQKLVGMARALVSDPTLLILDEPAAGMSLRERQVLMDLIQTLKSRGISVLLVEHDIRMVMRISDWLVVLNFGSKIAEGTPARVKRERVVIDAYLGEQEVQ